MKRPAGASSSPVYEPLSALESEILVHDTARDLSSAQRAAKRRRVEGIAKDYLNGARIFIQTASLRGPLERNWTNPWNSRTDQDDELPSNLHKRGEIAKYQQGVQAAGISKGRSERHGRLLGDVALSDGPLATTRHASDDFVLRSHRRFMDERHVRSMSLEKAANRVTSRKRGANVRKAGMEKDANTMHPKLNDAVVKEKRGSGNASSREPSKDSAGLGDIRGSRRPAPVSALKLAPPRITRQHSESSRYTSEGVTNNAQRRTRSPTKASETTSTSRYHTPLTEDNTSVGFARPKTPQRAPNGHADTTRASSRGTSAIHAGLVNPETRGFTPINKRSAVQTNVDGTDNAVPNASTRDSGVSMSPIREVLYQSAEKCTTTKPPAGKPENTKFKAKAKDGPAKPRVRKAKASVKKAKKSAEVSNGPAVPEVSGELDIREQGAPRVTSPSVAHAVPAPESVREPTKIQRKRPPLINFGTPPISRTALTTQAWGPDKVREREPKDDAFPPTGTTTGDTNTKGQPEPAERPPEDGTGIPQEESGGASAGVNGAKTGVIDGDEQGIAPLAARYFEFPYSLITDPRHKLTQFDQLRTCNRRRKYICRPEHGAPTPRLNSVPNLQSGLLHPERPSGCPARLPRRARISDKRKPRAGRGRP